MDERLRFVARLLDGEALPAALRGPSVDPRGLCDHRRICMHRKKINVSIVLAGQRLGLKEADDGIWLVSFMHYDPGYIDLEQRTLQLLAQQARWGLRGRRAAERTKESPT